jgi:hypothetical protein
LPLRNERATTTPYERSASSYGPRRSQRIRKSAFSDNYKVYVSEIQIEVDPTSFEEAMRSDHLLKWLEAM